MAHYYRVNPWLVSLFCYSGLIFMLAVKCFAQPAAASSPNDLLTGNNIPDFTATYQCRVRNALAGTPREQIARQAHQWCADYSKRYPKKPLPSDTALQITEQIMQQVTADAKAAQTVCTISKRGNKLLVITQFPRVKQTIVFIYDGARSMCMVRGADARVASGFQYGQLSSFIFPGCGLCSVPLGKELLPVPGSPGVYRGLIAMQLGAEGKEGLPDYRFGQIKTEEIRGVARIRELQVGWPIKPGERASHGRELTESDQVILAAELGCPRQVAFYSDYRDVSGALSLPERIHLTELYKPGSVLRYGEQRFHDWTLQSASATALEESEFHFESQLKGVAPVQDISKTAPDTIIYKPGKTLDQQFAAEHARRQQADLLKAQTSKSHSVSGMLGLVALLAALCGWYLRWRIHARRDIS